MLFTIASSSSQLRVGNLYDPALQVDYTGPPCYELKENKLVQFDVRDIAGNLIPPWRNYIELRPGTLVLVEATLHCYIMAASGSYRRDRKVRNQLL